MSTEKLQSPVPTPPKGIEVFCGHCKKDLSFRCLGAVIDGKLIIIQPLKCPRCQAALFVQSPILRPVI